MERLLTALLRGEPTSWSALSEVEGPHDDDRDGQRFLAAAVSHLVLLLIARQLRRGILSGAPPVLERTLARAAVQQAAIDGRLAAETRRVLEALARAGVPSLVTKGASLAFTHYPYPCLRPRTDTDLLIRARDTETAFRVLESLQYDALDMTRGDLLLHQRTYIKADSLGLRHVYDVHWKLAAPRVAAELLQWDEVWPDARSIPALSPHARTLSDAHALLLACVHRIAHHFDSPTLIWLYDIHLLASSLDDAGIREFTRLANRTAAASMCARSLALAQGHFGTRLPAGLVEALERRKDDTAARFGANARPIDVLLSDLRALTDWQDRMRLLRQHLVPPVDYMRRRYGVASSFALPILYAHRCVTGVRRWLLPAAR